MLGLPGAELWLCTLHHDVDAERQAHSCRLRDRPGRSRIDVCPRSCLGECPCPTRLEQQLCRRAQQVRLHPLRQLPPTVCGQRRPEAGPARRAGSHTWQNQYLWCRLRQGVGRSFHLLPHLDRRPEGLYQGLSRQGTDYQRTIRYGRLYSRHSGRQPAAADEVYLQERVRAPCSHVPHRCGGNPR